MRIAITNDDGIDSDGLWVLADTIRSAGHDVTVVAPNRDCSGASASLGSIAPNKEIVTFPAERDAFPGLEAHAVDGPPALCALIAGRGVFGAQPDVLVSGINAGLNTGDAILHSGTVGAAMTAQNFGHKGLAVSLQWSTDAYHWDTAARCAVDALNALVTAPERTALNLNVPNVAYEQLAGIRWTAIAPNRTIDLDFQLVDHVLTFNIGPMKNTASVDTDDGAHHDGWASISAIAGPVEVWEETPGDASLRPGSLFDPKYSLAGLGRLEPRITAG